MFICSRWSFCCRFEIIEYGTIELRPAKCQACIRDENAVAKCNVCGFVCGKCLESHICENIYRNNDQHKVINHMESSCLT